MLRLYASGLADSTAGASGRTPHPLGAQLPFSSAPACTATETPADTPIETLMRKTCLIVMNIVMYCLQKYGKPSFYLLFPIRKTAGEAYHYMNEQAYERFWKWISGYRC
jgi:hypothetical protein